MRPEAAPLQAFAYDYAVSAYPLEQDALGMNGICPKERFGPMPLIDFNHHHSCLLPEIVWRCSTRVLLKYELHQLRCRSAQVYRLVNGTARYRVPVSMLSAERCTLVRKINYERANFALAYKDALSQDGFEDKWRTLQEAGRFQRLFKRIARADADELL